ncbi:MAG: hypothetical protein JWM11_3144 [Planctomycetaceae bacterium]|nr:hypothetical protein [Planctomycetaceae bacterium]
MDVNVLQRQFARIGARAQVRWLEGSRIRGSVALDIVQDRVGELFDIRVSKDTPADVEVLHAEPQQRHLLLMSRSESDEKHKFLCGHDERHWFVAAVPENRVVSTVRTAMEALKPAEVVGRQLRMQVRKKNWNRRRNDAFIRQGEWFFVPEPQLIVNANLVLTNEPLRRGGGKPHMVEFLYRSGGEVVYVSSQKPNGLTQTQFNTFVSRRPEAKSWNWSTMRRNPSVYVKGRVRHADHATIVLHDWHQVLMNTESQAVAMRHVAFLD